MSGITAVLPFSIAQTRDAGRERELAPLPKRFDGVLVEVPALVVVALGRTPRHRPVMRRAAERTMAAIWSTERAWLKRLDGFDQSQQRPSMPPRASEPGDPELDAAIAASPGIGQKPTKGRGALTPQSDLPRLASPSVPVRNPSVDFVASGLMGVAGYRRPKSVRRRTERWRRGDRGRPTAKFSASFARSSVPSQRDDQGGLRRCR